MLGTKIILQNENGEFSVRVDDNGMHISAVLEKLVVPVLLAAEYHQDSIDDYIKLD